MNFKYIALSLILASSFATVNAQEAEKCKKPSNIYIGAGIGGMTVLNGGMNSPTFNINVKVGKYITPVWGVRAELAGAWQSLEYQENRDFQDYCKKFMEVNLDGTLSLTNLFMKYNPERKLNFYVFAGPTMNIASAVSLNQIQTITGSSDNVIEIPESYLNGGGTYKPSLEDYKVETETKTDYDYETEGAKARFGVTAGWGLDINLNNKWALNIENRYGVTPSIFGWGSDCRSAEATTRLTVGFKYTFGGIRFCCGKGKSTVVEKEVIKEVVKEVPVEVIKEIIKEVPSAASAAIFFKIGKSVISEEGMVNVKLMAKVMKKNPTTKYKVAGFADKGTGTVEINQRLSEARAQAVYDALIAEGISADRLEKVAMGGTDPMFEKGYLNRVVILEVK